MSTQAPPIAKRIGDQPPVRSRARPPSDDGRASSLSIARMTPSSIEQRHAELAALGKRLRKHDEEGAELDKDLAIAIERGQSDRLPMAEIAERVGVTRPTLYNALRRARAKSVKGRPGTQRPKSDRKKGT
jgi:DNA-directed RNA polymerase specialized sigma24 family protein